MMIDRTHEKLRCGLSTSAGKGGTFAETGIEQTGAGEHEIIGRRRWRQDQDEVAQKCDNDVAGSNKY